MFAEEIAWGSFRTVVAVGQQETQASRSCAEHAHPHFARRHVSESLVSRAGCCDVAAPLARRVLEVVQILGDGRRISWSCVASPPAGGRAVSAGATTATTRGI
jgi:hypothetical protein